MILIFQRVLTNYRLSIFREINKTTGAILCIGKHGPKNTFLSISQPDFMHFTIRDYYPIVKKENLVFQDVLTPIIKFKPDVIILEFALSILSNWITILLRPFFKYKIILWSHGCNRKNGFKPEKSLSDKIRLWWINRSDAIILYGQEFKKRLVPFFWSLPNNQK